MNFYWFWSGCLKAVYYVTFVKTYIHIDKTQMRHIWDTNCNIIQWNYRINIMERDELHVNIWNSKILINFIALAVYHLYFSEKKCYRNKVTFQFTRKIMNGRSSVAISVTISASDGKGHIIKNTWWKVH